MRCGVGRYITKVCWFMFIEDLCVDAALCSRAIYFAEFERINSVLYYGRRERVDTPPASQQQQLLWPPRSHTLTPLSEQSRLIAYEIYFAPRQHTYPACAHSNTPSGSNRIRTHTTHKRESKSVLRRRATGVEILTPLTMLTIPQIEFLPWNTFLPSAVTHFSYYSGQITARNIIIQSPICFLRWFENCN